MKMNSDDWIGMFCVVGVLAWLVGSWFTHLYTCFVNESWGFLIAGAIMFPIAWVHGTGVWFGWW